METAEDTSLRHLSYQGIDTTSVLYPWLRKFEVPWAPVLSMKEIANDPDLRASGTVVEVDEELRGKYLTVGSPIKFSDFTPKITGAPLLREHTDEVLAMLGYSKEQIAKVQSDNIV